MPKMFIAKKRKNYNNIIKIMVCVILVLLSFIITIKYLFKNFTFKNNSQKVNELLAVSTNNLIGELSLYDIINFNLRKPETILKMSFSGVKISGNDLISSSSTSKQEQNVSDLVIEPTVYIYNTHQTEEYSAGSLKNYNITPTVYMAANMLKKGLNNYGIKSLVEDENIKDVLSENNWNYNESYYASKLWLERAAKNNLSLKYFIDLHRDSVSLTATINDKKYAKMMFVIGMNHDNYEKNEELVLKLNEYLKTNYDGLMRDIFYGKRSQYNQDFNENTFLVEIGGPKNTIEEVNNSTLALADALAHVIGGI